MGSKKKPFELGNHFSISNAVFDEIMPRLSPNGWKILCVAIRQTWGWRDEEDPTGRKQWDQISYGQFREKAGIASDATVRRALKECIKAGYILRRQVGNRTGTDVPVFAYSLNRGFELEEGSKKDPATETVVDPATETVVDPATETVETKGKKRQQKGGGGFSTAEQQDAFEALIRFGVESLNGRRLAKVCSLEQVEGWIDFARRAKGLTDPAAFVASRLQQGEPAPIPTGGNGDHDPYRFIEGEYADLIEY